MAGVGIGVILLIVLLAVVPLLPNLPFVTAATRHLEKIPGLLLRRPLRGNFQPTFSVDLDSLAREQSLTENKRAAFFRRFLDLQFRGGNPFWFGTSSISVSGDADHAHGCGVGLDFQWHRCSRVRLSL